jgi:hypothetical protein
MARWRNRPEPGVPEWIWGLPAGDSAVRAWYDRATVGVKLEYLRQALGPEMREHPDGSLALDGPA